MATTRTLPVHRRLALVAVPVALLAASACSSSSSPAGGGTTSSKVPAALSTYFPGTKATGSVVKIGLINPEGGATTDLPDLREAAEAALKYANEQLGGIGGHQIEYVICKSKEDPASSRDCANQMVEAKVAAVLTTATGMGDAIVPVVTGAGIPYVAAQGNSGTEFASPHAYMWTGGFPGTMLSIAKFSKGLGYQKVNALALNAPAVIGGISQLATPMFTAMGMKITITPLPLGAADVTPQVTTAEKGKPDAELIAGDAPICIAVLKALQTTGTKTQVLAGQPCSDAKVTEAVGSALDGAKIFSPYDTSSDDIEAQLYRYVMSRYAPSANSTGLAGIAYEGALTLFRAVKDVTDVTPAGIDAALKAAKGVPIAAGHGMTATCDGKQFPTLSALCSSGAMVSTVESGKLTKTVVI
jgi:branched-chain amino acid transport system substrate-binding protein